MKMSLKVAWEGLSDREKAGIHKAADQRIPLIKKEHTFPPDTKSTDIADNPEVMVKIQFRRVQEAKSHLQRADPEQTYPLDIARRELCDDKETL